MFRFFDGVPRLIVPDNLKSGVSRASFYDPEINRSYGMMASRYGAAFLRQGRDGRGTNRKSRTACVSPSHAFWGGCATRLSSRWPRLMLLFARQSIASMITSCAGCASVAGNCLRASSVPHSQPSGRRLRIRRVAFGSRLDGLPRRVQDLLLFRTAQPHSPASRPEQRHAPSRSSTAASALPSISAAMAALVMGLILIICPAPPVICRSGRRIVSVAGPHPSGLRRKAWLSQFSPAAILNRVPPLFATLAIAGGVGRYGRILK